MGAILGALSDFVDWGMGLITTDNWLGLTVAASIVAPVAFGAVRGLIGLARRGRRS